MPDSETTIAGLKQLVAAFVDLRDWRQFHNPKNLSMSMAIETAELMEHFQWLSTEESRDVARDSKKLGQVADELADVFCYALAMANQLEIDIADAVQSKMAKNEAKYPAETYRGRYGRDDRRHEGGQRGPTLAESEPEA